MSDCYTDTKRAEFKEWAAKALPPELWYWAEMDLNTFAAIAIMYAEAALAAATRDSERLEWVMEHSQQRTGVGSYTFLRTREAIDAAMAKEQKP